MTDTSDGEDGTIQDTVRVADTGQHSFVVRFIWFCCIGWWVTGTWLAVAWLLNVTLIGLPVGLKMINMVPTVLTLRRRSRSATVVDDGQDVTYEFSDPDQYGLGVRLVYFLLVGWWLSAVCIVIAWLVSLTIVGLPIAVLLFEKLPFITSLYRYG